MDTIKIRTPDDWHLHLRSGEFLAAVLPFTIRCFQRAIVMPNLKPPVAAVASAETYYQNIKSLLPAGSIFEPLMTLYLTPETTPELIAAAAAHPHIYGVKLYPAGATTNSDYGVGSLKSLDDIFAAMQEHDLVLQVHGEDNKAHTDPFDREAVFIEEQLLPLRQKFPDLRIVLEHATTTSAVDFVNAWPRTAATVTPQHLLLNRGALFAGGLRPHHYCLPVLKREEHRKALLQAVTTPGQSSFFLGTDSAPHPTGCKHSACGCAGIFSAHAAIELYAEAFDSVAALDQLETFSSLNGPAFYGLPVNSGSITLKRESWTVPVSYPFGSESLVPLRADEQVHWRIVG
ncbi:MAG: dihydroorotase [Leptospiraceae bacterium]|nr:dihydroorotase [Leptospiraceae bacterium]